MANKKKNDPYSKETVQRLRTFPKSKAILLAVLVAAQILLAVLIFVIPTPAPQDVINEYEITVLPQQDGSLDLEYRFVWTPLDPSEPLTWVDIGVPNPNFTIYGDSLSDSIKTAVKNVSDGYVSVQIDFDRPYIANETLEFSFRINQHWMLSENETGYFYRFVPGWFNATPVTHYEFKWKDADGLIETNADAKRGDYYVWEGALECGDYVYIRADYDEMAFHGATTVVFESIDTDGAFNELEEDRIGIITLLIFGIVILLIVEIVLIDAFVSYHRGRGFLTGYGYHIHTYGRTNPNYRKESERRSAAAGRSGYSGGGRSCACACACACAGGGRAGCSQKDTYVPRRRKGTAKGRIQNSEGRTKKSAPFG